MQTKNSALSFSVHVYVASAQKRYEMAKFTSFHEDERQGDKFFNIVNYRIYPPSLRPSLISQSTWKQENTSDYKSYKPPRFKPPSSLIWNELDLLWRFEV